MGRSASSHHHDFFLSSLGVLKIVRSDIIHYQIYVTSTSHLKKQPFSYYAITAVISLIVTTYVIYIITTTSVVSSFELTGRFCSSQCRTTNFCILSRGRVWVFLRSSISDSITQVLKLISLQSEQSTWCLIFIFTSLYYTQFCFCFRTWFWLKLNSTMAPSTLY